MSLIEDSIDNDEVGNQFVESLLVKYDENKELSIDDIDNETKSTFHINDQFKNHLQKIVDNAKNHARKQLPAKKKAIKRTAGIFEDSVNSAFDKIKDIPDDILLNIRQEWLESGGDKNIVFELIKRTVEQAADYGVDKKELKDALYELYDKQKNFYKSSIRTTTVNAYGKAQLEEWDSEGIVDVERHCVDDDRTCSICRAICSPGRNMFKIKDLLLLEKPVTHFTHPQCRDWFTPIVDWSNLNEFFDEPIIDIEIGDTKVQNLPMNYQESLVELDERIGIGEENFVFVPDIVDTPQWVETRTQFYEQQGLNRNESEDLAETDKENYRGQVLSFDTVDGTLLSGNTVDSTNFAYSLAVNQAKKKWKDADKDFWTGHYDDLTGNVKPFISLLAEESPQNLFIEEYIMFHTNPFRLLSLDDEGYDELSMLTGIDFVEDGAI